LVENNSKARKTRFYNPRFSAAQRCAQFEKMKCVLTISILTLTGQFLFGQQKSTWTDIDTLESFNERSLVEYRNYVDSNITEHARAYFYPTVREVPRFKILKNLFKTEIQADSIVFHGDRKTYLGNRYFKSEKFENGKLISTMYFDSTEKEISKNEFHKKNYLRGPSGHITGHYFYHGKKRKNRAQSSRPPRQP